MAIIEQMPVRPVAAALEHDHRPYQRQIEATDQEIHRLVYNLYCFAPITSSTKALSYALAATGMFASYDGIYGHVDPEHYRYFVSEFEDTHVAESENGYNVNLFTREECGCGYKSTFEATVSVSRDGLVKELGRQKVYEGTRALCVD